MTTEATDEAREERISMEIIVDAYGGEEQALGWYSYLEGTLQVPFRARCTVERAPASPPRRGEVAVVGLAPEEECRHEIFVAIRWERRTLAVPLAQLAAIATDEMTQQAMEDWQYWVKRGYEF